MSAKQHKRLRRIAIQFAAVLESSGRKVSEAEYSNINGQRVLKKDCVKSIIKSLKDKAK